MGRLIGEIGVEAGLGGVERGADRLEIPGGAKPVAAEERLDMRIDAQARQGPEDEEEGAAHALHRQGILAGPPPEHPASPPLAIAPRG